MGNVMKYIRYEVLRTNGDKTNIVIMFSNDLIHKEVSARMRSLIVEEFAIPEVKAVSAGFVGVDFSVDISVDINCYGNSESMKLHSHADDSYILAEQMS
jgi:predicted RND superfamily exporter protein